MSGYRKRKRPAQGPATGQSQISRVMEFVAHKQRDCVKFCRYCTIEANKALNK